MKKYLLVILALLLTIGVANATNIPVATDPKNYPTVWTELVYNGSGSDITSSAVVIWDFDTSDVDNNVYDDTAMWVKLCDDADSPWTAGVVPFGHNFANGTTGPIIIKGPAVVSNAGSTTTVNTIVSGGTSGQAVDETASAVDGKVLGVVIKASAVNNDIGGDASAAHSLIYVDPTLYENGA